ncbi:DNA helicase [Gordonia phage Dardanus]|uniref:DNA helicase n=1 Tax=Gordonia phage Dardanus TaxID=2588489 RepID=A0A514CX47_9CAUD|nr:DNA helicase [Gordonia phage Dardanus]QDH85085.1 DNA helicase [Gordonia phage Dardanus]
MIQSGNDQLVAADVLAEQILLGSAITWPDRCADLVAGMDAEEFYLPKHRDLAAILAGMVRRGQGIDPVSVFGQVQAQGLTSSWDAVDLVSLTQTAVRPEMAGEHAKRVRELSGRRRLTEGAVRAAQRLQSLAGDESRDNVRSIADELRRYCDEAESVARDRAQPAPQGMGEFLAEEDRHDWLVPGLLERMDRTIITGGEGGGKSVLCSQFAACLAGGVHPFSGQVMGRGDQNVRVLVLDCENSPAQSRRRYRQVVRRVDLVRDMRELNPVVWNEYMQIDMRPAGVDLLSSRDVSWVEHALSASAPDLLVMGPLYKLHHEDANDEKAAREVAWVLDGLRERYGVALLTEAHSGKAKDMSGKRLTAPIGSSVWLRWPEFGFGLSPADDTERDQAGRAKKVDVVPWRGAREERAWPTSLEWGHTLPWLAGAEYEEQVQSAL